MVDLLTANVYDEEPEVMIVSDEKFDRRSSNCSLHGPGHSIRCVKMPCTIRSSYDWASRNMTDAMAGREEL